MPRHATATSYGGKRGNVGIGGDKGGHRPPDVYVKRMAYLEKLAVTSERWKRILEDATGDFATNTEWLATAREVFDRKRGKATQAVDVTSGGKPVSGIIALPVEQE